MYDYEDRLLFYAKRLREELGDNDLLDFYPDEIARIVGHPTEDMILDHMEDEDEEVE